MVPVTGTPLRAHRLRPVNVPRRVTVELNERGLPIAIQTVGRSDGQTAGERQRIEAIGEIWLVDDEWWRNPIQRRYIEVVFRGGKHIVLYEDRITNEWFEQTA